MKEVFDQINSLIGVKYKSEPPFSVEEGFNCFSCVSYIWELFANKKYVLPSDFSNLRLLRDNFIKLPPNIIPKPLDIPIFFNGTISTRHVGIMQDERMMIHASRETNGVARTDITKSPWRCTIQAIYRHK